MAVYTSINYAQPVDAGLMNEHTSEVIAAGVYKGMYIRPHDANGFTLDVRNVLEGEEDKLDYRVDLYGLAVMPQGMRVKLTSPQFYSENDPILGKLVLETPSEQDRFDLVYLEYEYKNEVASLNRPCYGVIKGTPSDEPLFPEIYDSSELSDDEEQRAKDIFRLKSIRIPLAYVSVRANSSGISQSDIHHSPRVMHSNDILTYFHSVIHKIMGNTKLKGMDLSASVSSDTVEYAITAGSCLIDGKPYDTSSVSGSAPVEKGILYEGYPCSDASASLQPSYPAHVAVSVDITVPEGTVIASITGMWMHGNFAAHRTVDIVSGEDGRVINTAEKLLSVDPSGIDMSALVPDDESSPKPTVHIGWICDVHILAVSRNDCLFIEETSNSLHVNNLTDKELLLGTVMLSSDNVSSSIEEVRQGE